jgi:hypothetical protein
MNSNGPSGHIKGPVGPPSRPSRSRAGHHRWFIARVVETGIDTGFADSLRSVAGNMFQTPTRSDLQRARWLARSRLARTPLYLHLARFSDAQTDEWLIARHKQLCVDGFPRSATTFAVAAFQLAQPHPVSVAHHSHAPAQVCAAVRWGIPTVVTIREPEQSVLSTAVYLPFLTVASALRAYVAFYDAVRPFRSAFLVSDFSATTTRLGSLIRTVNETYGTRFAEYTPTRESEAILFRIIDHGDESSPANRLITEFLSGGIGLEQLRARLVAEMGIDLDDPVDVCDATVARPSNDRERRKEALRDSYRSPALADLRRRAERVYAQLAEAR